MNFGAILAGGTGTRMGCNLPKQFIDLCGKPIIIWTIERMMSVNEFDYLFVGIHPDFNKFLEDLLVQYNIPREKIILVKGGKERIDSITNVLNKIFGYCQNDDDIVVIHDAVRPFVSKEILLNSIKISREYGACVATTPAVDTMYMLDNTGFIKEFPDRKTIFNGQAPDSFRVRLLKNALDSMSIEEKNVITGTVQICAQKGFPVKTIQGDYRNIKITTESDLAIAETIVKMGKLNESMCARK